jgi:S-adenosylmethionine:tRNA ribosyltransferase-isomerase
MCAGGYLYLGHHHLTHHALIILFFDINMKTNTKQIRISDYNYPLPDSRIAKFPLARRDASKLLVYRSGEVSEDTFAALPDYLSEGSLMVFNNTKVIMARIHFRKATGALIEVFLLEPVAPADYQVMFLENRRCEWCCLVGNLKKWKGEPLSRTIEVDGKQVTLTASRVGEMRTGQRVVLEWDCPDITFSEILDVVGELPIPPYLNRASEESDKTTYQTVYSKIKGSVAAPTAGLHFTDEVLRRIDAKGIIREELTLHVGAGTFRPVKSEEIEGHEMHSEQFCVQRSTIQRLLSHQGHVVAVGTTSVRTLESLYYLGARMCERDFGEDEPLQVTQWEPYDNPPAVACDKALEALLRYLERYDLSSLHAATQIIIAPGYEYKVVNQLVTNFHQPQSTLLLLVSAFVHGDWHRIYDYALSHDFRFLSYGDSSLLIP